MTPAEVHAWRDLYLVTRQQLADLLGVDQTTVSRWERGYTPPPRWLPLALETLGGQRAHLAKKMRERGVALKRRHAGPPENLLRGRKRVAS